MVSAINEAFPSCINNCCLDSSNLDFFYIHETTSKKSAIYNGNSNPDYPHFTVRNPNSKTVNLLAIDHCVLLQADGEKCDFAVFHDQVFCFVELKLGYGNKCNHKRQKAHSQLESTIIHFKERINFNNFIVEAYPCVGYKQPSPRATSSNSSRAKEFVDKYNVLLCQGNERVFE